MADINVSPEGLREAGKQLNTARVTLIDQSNLSLLHGVGDDQHISTAGFWPGVWAQKNLSTRYNEAQEAFLNVNNNFMAISSALYIVADLFDSTDQADALGFAFLTPGAATPRGLPAYMIDPETGKVRTSVQMREQAEAELETQGALHGGELPGGWTRRERQTSPYTSVVEIVDGSGKVVAAMYTSSTPGETRVSYYQGDKLVSTRVTRRTGDTEVVSTYDANDRLLRSQHQVHNENGSTTYYTNVYDPEHPDQAPTVENQITIEPETPGALPGEDITRTADEQEYLARTRHLRENAPGGVRPEDYEGPHNRYQ